MILQMKILILFVFAVSKVFGEVDCESNPYELCNYPKILQEVPREVSEFNDQCPEIKTYLKCLKDFQDACDKRVYFEVPGTYEATMDAFSSLCEEGSFLYTAATENLKCLNDTLSQTNCRIDAYHFNKALMEKEEADSIDLRCVGEAYINECVKLAIFESCGEQVKEAASRFIRQAKLLENYCDLEKARSTLEKMDVLDLTEDLKNSIAESIQDFVNRNNELES